MTEDLTVFFSTAEFATAATLNGAAVNGILDESSELVVDGVLAQAPAFTARTADTSAAAAGQSLVASGTTYKVRQVVRVPPDGALTQLVLARA